MSTLGNMMDLYQMFSSMGGGSGAEEEPADKVNSFQAGQNDITEALMGQRMGIGQPMPMDPMQGTMFGMPGKMEVDEVQAAQQPYPTSMQPDGEGGVATRLAKMLMGFM